MIQKGGNAENKLDMAQTNINAKVTKDLRPSHQCEMLHS